MWKTSRKQGFFLSWLVFLAAPPLSPAAEKPNVVLILIDDLGARDLGCYGSKFYHTPRIDGLAANGMRFTDGYAACPVCSPTRAALMTGKYPARLNITDWLPGDPGQPTHKLLRPTLALGLPLDEPNLPKALRGAGYATAHIGKWHLGGEKYSPTDQGFDLNIAGDHTGTPLSYFAPFESKGRTMPGLEKSPEGEYLTDCLTSEAEKFIESSKNKPFFLYLAHYAVHTPLKAKPDILAKYKSELHPGVQSNPIYAAMIESVDESVGRILKKLDELKLTDRTIVIFTSDNGGLSVDGGPNTPATFNGPFREGKGYLYEGGIRVPYVIRCPGVTQPGTTSDVPISSIDLFPTILDLCGVKSESAVDGVSLAGVLKGGKLNREALYWHYPHYWSQSGRPSGAIRGGL